jgi:predicted amidohydrolase YtcJ
MPELGVRQERYTSTMLIEGSCWTMTAPALAGAVLVDGERIVEIGDAGTLRARHPGVRSVRVGRITPGVHDAHVHPIAWGRAMSELDLAGLDDPRAVAGRVAEHARALEPGSWVRGTGYLFASYPDSRLLDEAAPHHPVLLKTRDLHAAWANRRALAVAGVTRSTAEPEAGRILRDSRGEPTGYLLERAVGLLDAAVPPPDREDLRRGLADLARRGYTAAHSMALDPPEALAWAEGMAASGELPLRVWWAVGSERWRAVNPGWRGDDLEVAAVKMFADGSLGSRTAWMADPYGDGSSGMPVDTVEAIREQVRAALAAGFTAVVHAIGSRAVPAVLTTLAEVAPGAARPLRVEHLQHLRDEDVPLLATPGLAYSMQPIHLEGDAALVRTLLPGRRHEAFRLADVQASGNPLAFGSDAPVAKPDLAAGLRCATAHPLKAEQSLAEETAVRAFTRGAALAAGWNDYGVLEPGVRADLGLWEAGRLVGRVFRGRLEWC